MFSASHVVGLRAVLDHEAARALEALGPDLEADPEVPLLALRGGRGEPKPPAPVAGLPVNDEGVGLLGRAQAYYEEVRRLVEKHKGANDLSESLDVMDDSYGDVWSKLRAIEALAESRQVCDENTHLKKTLTCVDGVLKDGDKTVAIHTHRVYFHRAQNPRSEIEEGIRRVDGYLKQTLSYFRFIAALEHVPARLHVIGQQARPALLAPFVTRPPETIVDRAALRLPPAEAAAKGVYAMRRGKTDRTVVLAGSGVAIAFVRDALPQLDKEGLEINVFYVASAELFDLLPRHERESIFPERLSYQAMGITDFTMHTLWRWVRSNEGCAKSLHTFRTGRYLGSGQGDRVLAEAGINGPAQMRAIRDWSKAKLASPFAEAGR